ncbi:hypothetical protein [Rhodobacter calidifons]|uniref:hypothetical protein n=1 Tax=Rhodobacter calidifons TaxID=2715277 RepID=UPI001F611AFE|nr:hypothetical protein [Rhodobacter calidifons]
MPFIRRMSGPRSAISVSSQKSKISAGIGAVRVIEAVAMRSSVAWCEAAGSAGGGPALGRGRPDSRARGAGAGWAS